MPQYSTRSAAQMRTRGPPSTATTPNWEPTSSRCKWAPRNCSTDIAGYISAPESTS